MGLLAAVAVVLALGLVFLAAWSLYEFREREATHAAEVSRAAAELSGTEAARAELAARLKVALRDLETSRREAEEQREAARASAEAGTALQQELDAAEERVATLTRGVQRRDSQIDRLLSGLGGENALRDVAGSPGLELLRLRAVAPFQEGGGHVLWHPGRSEAVVYVFGLPPAPVPGGYRVRATLDDGMTVPGPSFTPGVAGDATLAIRLGSSARRLRAVEILLEPAARPVGGGRAGAAAG
jgi:hypothetical protein